MTHEKYLPSTDELKMKWLCKFSNGLGIHGADLGVNADTIKATKADADFFSELLAYLKTSEDYMSSLVTYKNGFISGTSTVITNVPTLVVMPTHVVVSQNIFSKARLLVANLKINPKLTVGMIQDMGLAGSEINYDFNAIVVNAQVIIKNSHPYSFWNHRGTDAVDIKCDYGDTLGMVNVARISAVNFLDPRLPASGVQALYKYKYRYVVKDQQVGEWSNEISIAVKVI